MSLETRRDGLDTLTSAIKFKTPPSLPWPRRGSRWSHPCPGQSPSPFLSPQPMLLHLETKLLHLFILKKKIRLIFGFRPCLIHVLKLQFLADVCTSCWKLPPWPRPCFGFLLVFILSSLWLIVVLLTTPENLVLLPEPVSSSSKKMLVTKHWVKS